MPSVAARACAALVAFAATAIVYAATSSFAPSWPPPHQPSTAALWLLDVVGRIPVGDAMSRAAILAVLFAALTSAITTGVIVRLGYQPMLATACAVTLACTPAVWHHATGDVTGALASLLIACAIAIVFATKASSLVRAVVASCFLVAAVGAGTMRVETPPATWREAAMSAVALVRAEWRLPASALVAAGLAAPIWTGARAPVLAIAGTGIAVVSAMIGSNVAPFAPFAAILLTHGVTSLPSIGARARAAIAIALALVTIAARGQDRRPPEWELVAWRDALERAVPSGTVIATGNRAAAALQPVLFADRPSRIEIRLDPAAQSPGSTVLDDLRAQQPRTAVTLAFTSPVDAISRLPHGTIIGLAVAAPVISDNAELVKAALQAIGHSTVIDAAAGVAAIGLAGMKDPQAGSQLPLLGSHVYLWLGDPIGDTGRRSPTDLDVRATDAGVRIRLRGRDVVTSDAWAAIALDRYGRVLATWASDDTAGAWPIDVKGLNVWR
jgi:hypothetical protein